ncbi:MAG: serine/threonine protein kinase [Oscillospiraceae bacterium]|jgi:hypothetical protein|nr:serine/threonine protein kinase [Oscillospiraceae bacterium]
MSESFTDEFRKDRRSAEKLSLPEEVTARFDVMERLSGNEYGVTLLLSEKAGGKRFVLKCCKKSETPGETNELELLRGLSHKGLPKYGAEIENGDSLCILYEFAEGVSLSQYMDEREKMDEALSVSVALELCGILSYLHTRPAPIIHRDIKPSNIIINPVNNSVTLIDFGISRRYSRDADTDTAYLGTKKYAPPEQYGFAQTDCRADIYALGVVLCFMLTGEPDGTITDNGLKRIAEKCTAFSPDDRYQSAEALKRALLKHKNRSWEKAALAVVSAAVLCLVFAAGLLVGRYTGFLMLSVSEAGANTEGAYVFSDPLVEKAVRVSLGKAEDETIYPDDLKSVFDLYFVGENVFANYDEVEAFDASSALYGKLKDISDLAYMENLSIVHISKQPIEDISPLAACSRLSSVHFGDCNALQDISPLANCSGLEQAHLVFCNISDLSPLEQLPILNRIHIIHNVSADLSSLESVKSLRFLVIAATPLRSLPELGNIGQVNDLGIHETQLDNLDGIENFTALSVLDLANSPAIRDFSALDRLPGLRELKISPDMERDVRATVTRKDIQVTIGN